MKPAKYLLTVFAMSGLLTGGLTSCSDFLETNPSTSVSDNQVFTTVSGAQAALNGCYYQMKCYSGGGANRSDDWGIPSIQMISDMCGEIMAVVGMATIIIIGEKLVVISSVQVSYGHSIIALSTTLIL